MLEEIVIPESVQVLGEAAFLNCPYLMKIQIWSSTCTIENIFGLNDGDTTDCVIEGYAGSTAEMFAANKGYFFQEIPNISLTEEEIGDISLDGSVQVDDAVSILTYYAQSSAGLDPYFSEDTATHTHIFAAADINQDNQITVEDAVMVLNYYAQQSAALHPTWESIRKG